MPRLHILQQSGNNLYNVVVHTPTPGGNNSVGVPWVDAIKNSGLAVTSMMVGNGPGQISQAEANQVIAGTVIETQFQWGDEPTWTNPQRQEDLNVRAQQALDIALADYAARLKYFGHVVA